MGVLVVDSPSLSVKEEKGDEEEEDDNDDDNHKVLTVRRRDTDRNNRPVECEKEKEEDKPSDRSSVICI